MYKKFALGFFVLGFLLIATPAFARGQAPSPLPTPRRGLATAALRACQARESAIKNRMESLTNLVTNMEKVFDSIATRVEDFYTNTVLPSGKSVPNYNALVTDISNKKATVDSDLNTAQNLVNSFSCTTDDPKGLLQGFRLDMQKVKTDLKNYRTSIKNLIVAVRPLAPEGTEKPEASPTP